MTRQVTLAHAIYPYECVQIAREAFQGLCTVRVSRVNPDQCSIMIETAAENEEPELMHEFLNYVLNVSLEWHLQRL